MAIIDSKAVIAKKEALMVELKALRYTRESDELEMYISGKEYERKRSELVAKIQLCNELLMM